MDVRQLEVFLAVMECSSVTRAAERIGLSPGAVSMQLQNLAAELRTDLFVRSGKHLAPTPAALRLVERGRGVMRGMRRSSRNSPATRRPTRCPSTSPRAPPR